MTALSLFKPYSFSASVILSMICYVWNSIFRYILISHKILKFPHTVFLSHLNLCVLVMPSTIVSHAKGPFLLLKDSPLFCVLFFPLFAILLSSLEVAFFGKGEHLEVWANSRCASHFNLWRNKIRVFNSFLGSLRISKL